MASDKNTIKLSELKAVIDKIFQHIQSELEIDEITIDNQYYHEIDLSNVFSDAERLPETSIGDLIADWEFLKPRLAKSEQVAVSMLFIHIAPILKYIAHKIGK